jgi:hypothetical protein
MCEDINDFKEVEKLGHGFSSSDPLEEIDIEDGVTLRLTFVNKNMYIEHKDDVIKFLKEYVDWFTWNYHEMFGLSWELLEYRLLIKSGFKPYKQPAQRFNSVIHGWVKEEVAQPLDTWFIQPCRYAEWVSNIVPVEKKKTDKIQVCIDFHNLNKATHKDEYHMPIAEILINNALENQVISFLYGNAGYNQIFMAESKMTFWCLCFIGLFEWVIMTFGFKMLTQHIKELWIWSFMTC